MRLFQSRPVLPTVALAALGVLAASPAVTAAAEHAVPQMRAVVADGRDGAVRVLDLSRERQVRRFRVAGPAALTTMEDGRHVLATQGAANRVDALDAGTWSETHGDHVHHETAKPRLLPFRLRTPKPVHTVPHGEQVAIFADGDGTARVFGLPALRAAARAERTLTTARPHHGVAVPFAGRTVVSETAPGAEDGDLPALLQVRDAGGAVVSQHALGEIHGEVSHEDWAAFAGTEGVLVVRPGAAAPDDATLLPYPRGSGEARAWGLGTDRGGRRIVGDLGPRALVVFEPAIRRARRIRVAGPVASFAVDDHVVLALTTDGLLRRIDLRTGRQTDRRRVVGRAFDPESKRPTPDLAARAGHAVVTDPARGGVTVVRTGRGLRLVHRFRTAGAPERVALAGGVG